MNTLAIDIETYSSGDLIKGGVYKYAEAEDFTVLLLSYTLNCQLMPGLLDFVTGEGIESDTVANLKKALQNPAIKKTAFNANFERVCLSKFFGIELDPAQWECTMVKASMLGLPLSLDAVAKVLRLQNQKDAAGKALIKYFSMPCKPTKINGGRLRNLPEHAPEKWEAFKQYCIKDVEVEQEIRERISFFEIPEQEKQLYVLDQKINDRGVRIDRTLVKQAVALDIAQREILTAKAIRLTGLDNPNSAAQLKQWLSVELDDEVTSLKKADLPLLKELTNDDAVKEVLQIRAEMSKTSVKKYVAMAKGVCADGRLRGIHQFYGANRTGRWAGRLVQPQNLPKNYLPDLELAREIVRSGDLELLTSMFGNVPDTLSQLIRTAIVAPKGSRLIVSDFSAIEARVIAWLAGEQWRLDVFNGDGKIYEASAAAMFKVPIEDVDKALRGKGKIAELALGYQGGPNALIAMGALTMGIPEADLPEIVRLWRAANKKIVALWYAVQDAAIEAITGGAPTQTHGIKFGVEKNILFITLPSGRRLAYWQPSYGRNRYGNDSIQYWGMDQTTKQWCQQDTYGGKLVENIVQAIARDCLAVKLKRLHALNFSVVMHVHDEIVIEENITGFANVVNEYMSHEINWAPGLPLGAEGYETQFYKKD